MNTRPFVYRIQAYKLPVDMSVDEQEIQQIETPQGVYSLMFPTLNEQKIREISCRLEKNRHDYLALLTTSEIIDKIDLAVHKWLDPNYPQRRLAELLLPYVTGYDADMIRLQLKRYMRTFRKKELLRFLDEEFDNPAMLDEFRPRKSGGFSRIYGPKLIFHIFSGNVPGISIWSLIMGLLLKSAQLGKTSSAEPLMAVWFAESLAEVDQRLGDAIAILPWQGGNREFEDPAIEMADAIITYGSNKTLENIRPRIPIHKNCLTFGHRISFAMIGQEALTPDRMDDTIARLAADIALYDQQSCLSPQSVFVEEGGSLSPQQFAQNLAAEMDRMQLRKPRADLTDAEAWAIQNERNRYTFEHDDVFVYESKQNTAWTVIYHTKPGFQSSPLNRTVHVYACKQLEEGIPFLSSFRTYLQSCGIAVSPARLLNLAQTLGEAGVSRICPLGAMNQAKPGWHHDGRFNLVDLIRYVDIEKGTEELAEQYDPDVE
ncbi:acyl-CoA reductase [Paenibacillus sp. GP183]|uniref:acyl-CoA reductase n=1 Tax=Paenibacillus sp. GP183 TaxID=1882751 RepID=UPI000895F538|nr:acyl-CoA reductase [Paenibacillus sp. GP183]SEC42778.1 Acyl-CoA reductase (LuxC) [Paenibacillus sp. GP183]